ncbi:MAG: hypothetical protein JW772_03210 [Candidatus Diapherotrites archaeon]|nr:hypothetical protein [Candidatus Diapherotrites archaeon]
MAKRIWKKPSSKAGKRAIRRSLSRQLTAHSRIVGTFDSKKVVSNYFRNKTPKQRAAVAELYSKGYPAHWKKADNAVHERVTLLAEATTHRKKSFLGHLTNIVGNDYLTTSQRIRELKNIRFLLSDFIASAEKLRKAQWDYSKKLAKNKREEYFEEFPLPKNRELNILRDFLKEIDQTSKRVEKAGFIDSVEFDKIVERLMAKLVFLEEQRPK